MTRQRVGMPGTIARAPGGRTPVLRRRAIHCGQRIEVLPNGRLPDILPVRVTRTAETITVDTT
jgi:hypothetical protein